MKKHMIVLAGCLLSLVTFAHPGIGIVKDKKGNIFYSDLHRVWKISANGEKMVVVPGVHTHELYMDSAGNLFGEHLWYNGEQANTWGHYVWSLKNDGSLVKLTEPTAGFLENYSFVRDDAGNMYWVERWKVSRIKKRSPDGNITTLAEGQWGEVRWMYATPAGNIYFTNWHNLYRADRAGNVTLLANDIDRSTATYSDDDRHNLYGIWTDKEENVYVAVRSAGMIKKINPGGAISVVVYTAKPWTPTGGLFDNAGNLWVLENSDKDEVRVRKIDRKGLAAAAKPVQWHISNNLFPITLGGLLIIGFTGAIMRFKRGKKQPTVI